MAHPNNAVQLGPTVPEQWGKSQNYTYNYGKKTTAFIPDLLVTDATLGLISPLLI